MKIQLSKFSKELQAAIKKELSNDSNVVEAANPQFFKERGETEAWLKEMGIKNYLIDSDSLVVDVDGNVDISNKGIDELPVQFGRISGDFDCSHNKLTQLIGAPKYVGDFDCSHNNLFSLLFSPKEADVFRCHDNRIISFEGLPKKLEELHCENNRIKSLKGLPDISGGTLVCDCQVAIAEIRAKTGAKNITLIPKETD